MENKGEPPYGVLGTAPNFGLREEIEFVLVFTSQLVLQTTSQQEIYGRVRTGCKVKRAGPAKFVVFHLLIALIAVVVTSAFVVAPIIYG